jgi:hypothetical protein
VPWRGRKATICRGCGRHVDEVGELSARYRCAGCGEGNAIANRRHLMAHGGPFFDHWRRAVAASVGAILVSELESDDDREVSRVDDP